MHAMATRLIKDSKTGQIVEVDMVEIVGLVNSPIVVTLRDGAVIRVKMDIAQAGRVKGKLSPQGEPIYQLQMGYTFGLLKLPEGHTI